MNNLEKKEALRRHYRQFTDAELPKILPPNLSTPKKTIKRIVTANGSARRIIIRG